MNRGRWSARRVVAVVLLTVAVHVPGALEAQTPGQLRDRCVLAGGDPGRCTDVAVGARTLTAQASLLAGAGSELPGSASTLGTKIGNRPRVSTWARGGGSWVGMPDIFHEGTGPASDVAFLVPSLQIGGATGLFDGFSPMSTVGGMLSLDLFGAASITMPPSSRGFGGSVTGLTMGGRVGILRESFTLPGMSVSFAHRFMGTTRLGDIGLGDPARIEIDPSVTSVRATIGKDLFGVGVLGGIGWDRSSADAVLEVQRADPQPARIVSPLDASRRLYFAGASLHFLLIQLSFEGGWAEGHPDVPDAAGSSFDPTGGSPFGSLALRFTP